MNLRVLLFGLYISSIISFANENSMLRQPIIRGSNTFTILDMYKTERHRYKINGTLHDIEGIVYVFLCSSNSDKDIMPSLTELLDFEIDGHSYQEMTIKEVGEKIESVGAIFDVNDFTNKYRPDLKKYLVGVPEKSIIMITTVYGSILPQSGIIITRVKLGWVPKKNMELQSYVFKTNLKNLKNITYLNGSFK